MGTKLLAPQSYMRLQPPLRSLLASRSTRHIHLESDCLLPSLWQKCQELRASGDIDLSCIGCSRSAPKGRKCTKANWSGTFSPSMKLPEHDKQCPADSRRPGVIIWTRHVREFGEMEVPCTDHSRSGSPMTLRPNALDAIDLGRSWGGHLARNVRGLPL